MISWMQKHNKYLVWTIWVATIAFIGAGFVGWGSYSFGSKAGNIAKVGNVEISQTKLNMVYSSIYAQYNEAMKGTLDEKKAKELGLAQQAFARLATQAKIINFAQEVGLIVSDEELVKKLETISLFQKEGLFNKKIYEAYLRSQRLTAKTFESTFREELLIQKTMKLLNVAALPLEVEAISAAINVSDKLAYQVLTQSDLDFVIEDAKVKAYWEMRKDNYMTPRMYDLSIVWTSSKDANVTEEEIKAYYDTNSFNYADDKGKQLTFDEAKAQAIQDLKLKKTKKSAQKAYIAFKKGKLAQSEKITLALNDMKLTKELWSTLGEKKIGDIVKPKVVADSYATIKIENIVEPKMMSYKDAQEAATIQYTIEAKKEALLLLAENELKDFNQSAATISPFLKLEENVKLNPLNTQESLQFLQKLFTSTKEKGIISIADKFIIYKILDQKLVPMDENKTDTVKETVNKLKQNVFESNLIKMLDKQYPTQTYMEGLTN